MSEERKCRCGHIVNAHRWTGARDCMEPACECGAFTPTPARSEAAGGFARSLRQMHEDREALGKIVRAIWIAWAKEQPNAKPSWLVPWEELSEPDREVDRRIGATIADFAERGAREEIAFLRQQLAAAREDGERFWWALRNPRTFADVAYNLDRDDDAIRRAVDTLRNDDRARTEPAREGEGGDA